MTIALWIIAALLAVLFLASGATKLFVPGKAVVEGFSVGVIKAVGVLEILAAIGLVVPAALGVAPVLVAVAAVGVALLMAGAITFHLRRHESREVALTLSLLALAAFVAWGRVGPTPFAG